MKYTSLYTRLSIVERYFLDGKYQAKVVEARHILLKPVHLTASDIERCNELLDSLPNEEQLLESLVGKLKDKPVYRTLKKLQAHENIDKHIALKGLFSLGTHAAIECEHGKKEYGLLLPFIHEKIGSILFGE